MLQSTVETGSSLLWNKMRLTCQHSCAWKTLGRGKNICPLTSVNTLGKPSIVTVGHMPCDIKAST